MDWDDVRYFLALARSGSVRSAGSNLGVSHSTVARRVEALEGTLSARLFDRHRDGYLLTAAGRHMVPSAERIEREMADMERALIGRDERFSGRVALTCCDTFVSKLMMPALSAFCRQYPEIELSMTADSRSMDLSKREADIALRILAVGQRPPEHLLGRKLVPLAVGNYVARAHRDALDPARGGENTRWLAYDERRITEQRVRASSHPTLPIWGEFASLGLMIQAAEEGLGVCMLPCYAADTVESLVRLEADDVEHVADLWLLSHPDLRDTARMQAARECAGGALRQHEDLFDGRRPLNDA